MSRQYDFQNLASDLQQATITFSGTDIKILVRNRDRLPSELKGALSQSFGRPVCFTFQHRAGFKQEWWCHGNNHNPNGGPALKTITDTDIFEQYNTRHGWIGNDHGPALVHTEHGKRYREIWISTETGEEHKHRIGGPATTEITYHVPTISGKSTFKERWMDWYQGGKYFREDDLWTYQHDENGTETFEATPYGLMRTLRVAKRTLSWYNSVGEPHRTNGPAEVILRGVIEVEKPGREIRVTWNDWSGYWCVNGIEIPYGKILKWAKSRRILMWDSPCFDRSAFRTADGEVCFTTDWDKI